MLIKGSKIKKSKILNAIVASIIIFTLLSSDFFILGKEVMAIAEDKSLNAQTENTLNKNVKFDTFFEKDNEKTHYLISDVNEESQNMYMNLSVKEGYLKNASITLKDNNYIIKELSSENEIIQSAEKQKIDLKQINSETENKIIAKIGVKLDEKINLKDLNKESKVILKATYINVKGEEQPIEKEVKINVEYKQKLQVELTQEVNSYFAFQTSGQDKVLVKLDAKLNLLNKINSLPIKQTILTAKVPTLNGVKPESVSIIPKNTKMTNGQTEENVNYSKEQIEYKQEQETISIKVENKETDGKVFTANGQDEYTITYIYPKQNISITEPQKLISNIEAKLNTYTENPENNMIATSSQIEMDLTEEKGKPLSFEVTSDMDKINKGKMYANSQMEEKEYETAYTTEWKIEVSGKNVVDGIRVEDRSEYFTDVNKNKYLTVNYFDSYTHYTKTVINKNNFENILGKDGYINFYNQSGELIKKVDSSTYKDSKGNYIIGYEQQTDKIIMETSKPLAEGTLYIKHDRVIEADLPYSLEQFRKFTNLEEKTSLVQMQNNSFMVMEENILSYDLEETTTKADIVLDKKILSTLVTNENIEIKIELNNNRQESDLYINPVFLIELPEYVEDIKIKNASVVFDENLQIQNIEKIEQNGKYYIRITMQGTQNGFSNGKFTNGTNIVLNTDIKAKLLTPSIQDQIKLYYLNPNAVSYETSEILGEQLLGTAKEDISYSTPTGMLAVSSMSNYDNTGKEVTSVYQGKIADKIGIYEDAKITKTDLKVVNNTGNTCDNIVAIGRLPFKGNKNINTDEDLGTTLDTKLKSKLKVNGIDESKVNIYYSENGEANIDLTNAQNAWTQEPQDLSTIKSYLVVLNDYQMPAGEAVEFSYDSEIPANLEYGNDLYNAFAVRYLNNTNIGIKDETTVASSVGLKTGEGPKMGVSQIISDKDKKVTEGEVLKVTTYIENTGENNIDNVVLRAYIPRHTKYTKYQEGSGDYGEIPSGYIYPETRIEEGTNREYIDIDLGAIFIGEIATVDYYLYVDNIEYKDEAGLDTIKIANEIAIFADGLEKPITNKSYDVEVNKALLQVNEKAFLDRVDILKEGQEVEYTININNITNYTITNLIAEKILPEILIYKEAYVCEYNEETDEWSAGEPASYDKNTKTIRWNIGNLEEDGDKRIKVVAKVGELPVGVYEQQISTRTAVTGDGISTQYSMDAINKVAKPHLVTSIKNDATKEYVSEGDRITYTITVKNDGKIEAINVNFEDILPNELRFISGDYIASNSNEIKELKQYGNKVSFERTILKDESITITIVTEAKNLPNDVEEKEISNYATFIGDNVSFEKTEELMTRIEQSPNLPNPQEENGGTNGENGTNGGNNSNSNNNGSTQNVDKTFRIRGLAWVDANNNGAREAGEQLLEGIEVVLTNAETGDVVKDKNSGQEKKTSTSNTGEYVFENLEQGNYIVVVYYDNQTFKLTDYKKSGVADSQNSDFVSAKVIQNEEEKEAAVSDTLRLKSGSYANIDIGLVNTKQFDLKLDKYISKVTVQNKDGVKTYNYNNTNLAKVDLTAKYMVGSTIVTEYKIKVTNEGNVAGYAKNIVDYMPSQMKFNSSLNPDWYAGNDGYLYNTELQNQVINPGETKEISLVLTKQVADTSSTIINNQAEIFEDYNQFGIIDIDSKIRNKAQNEDDMGSADLIISIRTGAEVTYTVVVLISLMGIACVIYIIRKRNAIYYN